MAKIIGIDLGTSNSAAAVMMGGKPTIIPAAEGISIGGKAFPSYVAFTKGGEKLVGEPARRQASMNPEGTIYAAKRKMGTDHKYRVHGKEYTPQQISAFILQKIREDSEAFLGEKVEKAVITVPAYFNDNQRHATKDAGKIAGLEVVRIINEPTAASLAYGIDKLKEEQKIMVFDFGGGTLDVTIMDFGDGVFEVKSTSGDTHLGGSDMDEVLINYVADEFKKNEGVDLREDKQSLVRLRDAVEKAKIELSNSLETEINLPYVTATSTGPKHLLISISRAKLEQLVDPVIQKCREPIERALKDAKIDKAGIDKVITVGGPTRMPAVKKFLEDIVGKKIEHGVDPMECVAVGAAIQAGVLAGDVTDLVLLDVTPLTLGIETLGGIMTPLIERNTTIPTKKSQPFTTAADFQTAVTINVLQGERPMAADNVTLGQFNLVGIPPAPRGIPQIEVTFDIDANGILNVSAQDKATNKQQAITITSNTKLTEDEIKKMKNEAEQYSDADKKKKQEVEIKNEAESIIYAAEKMITDLGDKISQENKDKIQSSAGQLKEALKDGSVDTIKTRLDALKDVMQQVGASMYQQAQQQEGGQAPGGQAPGGEAGFGSAGDTDSEGETINADYKVEDEK